MLKKEYSYNSTPHLRFHPMLIADLYIYLVFNDSECHPHPHPLKKPSVNKTHLDVGRLIATCRVTLVLNGATDLSFQYHAIQHMG
jgi:hypothetical protein